MKQRAKSRVLLCRVGRYALAATLVAAAVVLRVTLPGVLGGAPYLVLYPAIVAAAAFGGLGPGLLATVASGLVVDVWFVAPYGQFSLGEPVELARVVILLVGGVGISVVAGLRRSTLARERRLVEQNLLLRTGVESLTHPFYVIDAHDYTIKMANSAARVGELGPHTTCYELTHRFKVPCHLGGESCPIEQIRTTRKPFTVEHIHYDSEGNAKVYEVHAYPILDPSGDVVQIIEYSLDISERKRAEAALLESRKMLQLVLDTIPVRVFWKDTHSVFLGSNRLCAMDAGLSSSEELVGKTDFETAWRGQAELYAADDKVVMTSGVAKLNYEEPLTTPTGEQICLRTSKVPLRNERGEVVGLLGTYEDITERKRAEEQLTKEKTFSESAINSLPGVFYLFRNDGKFLRWNRNLEEVSGYSSQEISLMSPLDLFNPDEKGIVADAISRVFNAGEASVEARLVTKDGRRVPYFFVGRRTVIDDVPYLIGAGIDITDRTRIEAELLAAKISAERSKAAAEAASTAKDRFLAILSHELRTPLAPVLAAVSMFHGDARFDKETQRTLEMIRRNVELEARLIDDLLDLTRIARGKVELNKQIVELGAVIQRAVEVCRPDIKARRLRFGVDLGSAGPYMVEADSARLQQVFWNLLRNAVKFTSPGGGVGICCRREDDDHVVVEVSDSGVGIEPAVMSRIFNAFEQGDRSVTRQFGGLGLGLAISKSLVEMHGGTIDARSQGRDKGATFRVKLPVLSGSAATSPVAGGGLSARPIPQQKTRPLRLLLVEDHGDTAEMMRRMLGLAGHQVQRAGDVATALQMASRQEFDLLISDLGLPDGSGLDLMRELRARGQHLPGIALSGYGQEQDVQQSRDAGFAAHVVKPVDVERMLAVLESVVSS